MNGFYLGIILGTILGITITCIITSAKTADLLGKIDSLKIKINVAKEYIKSHQQIYDIDGTEDNGLDQFDALASPKVLLGILKEGEK